MNTLDQVTDSALILEQLLRLIIDMPMDKRLALLNQLEESAFEEDPSLKRDDTRRAYPKTVYFDFENFTYSGTIKDISTTGMFIETDCTCIFCEPLKRIPPILGFENST